MSEKLREALDATAEPVTDRSGQTIGVRIPEYLYVRIRAALHALTEKGVSNPDD